MLPILTFVIGFLLGMILEAKWKSNIQEKIWKELNELAESMSKLGNSMAKSQEILLKKLEGKEDENNR